MLTSLSVVEKSMLSSSLGRLREEIFPRGTPVSLNNPDADDELP